MFQQAVNYAADVLTGHIPMGHRDDIVTFSSVQFTDLRDSHTYVRYYSAGWDTMITETRVSALTVLNNPVEKQSSK